MMRDLAIAAVIIGLLTGCSPEAAPTDVTPNAPAYAAPPVAQSVRADGSGTITVVGQAGPDERVRLIQIDGSAHGVTADAAGAFAVVVPRAANADRLFNLSVERAGQSVSSDGWLFSPAAAPARAVMLRVGGASLPVGAAPLLAVVDMDAGGGVAMSGLAQSGEMIRISLDGDERGVVQAASDGRWFTVLSAAVAPGEHQVAVSAGDRREQRLLSLNPVRTTGAIETAQIDGAVRVAWALPGGGSQTTWILLP